MIQLINTAAQLANLALLARIILSWIPHNAQNPIIELVYQITEPLLKPFRSILPDTMGIDFSPILAFIAIRISHVLLLSIF